MSKVTLIEAGAIDFTLFNEADGKTIWRREDTSVPPMYRPTIQLSGKFNASRTNANMALKLVTPVTVTENGRVVPVAYRTSQFNHTALQSIDNSDAATDIDIMIAALTALKQNIIDGKASA